MLDMKTKIFDISKLIFKRDKKKNRSSKAQKSAEKDIPRDKKDGYKKEEKPVLLRSLAQRFAPSLSTAYNNKEPFLKVSLLKKTKRSVSLKRPDPMQEAMNKLDQTVQKINEDQICYEDIHQYFMESSPEYQKEYNKAYKTGPKDYTIVFSDLELPSYQVPLTFINNILSTDQANGRGQKLVPQIFQMHLNYLIENDPEINQNPKLLEKYKLIEKEFQNISNVDYFQDAARVGARFELGYIDKKEALSEIKELTSKEANKILSLIQENDQHLVRFNVPGHAILIEFEQEKDSLGHFNGNYTVRIFNGGTGVENHQIYTDRFSKREKNVDTCFTVEHISKKRLTEKDIEILLNFSVRPGVRLHQQSNWNRFFSGFEKQEKSKDIDSVSKDINSVYSFFKARGTEAVKIVHSSQSHQSIEKLNCTTRCFNSFFHQRLNGPGEYEHFMAVLYRNLRENNKMSAELSTRAKRKEENSEKKKQIAIHKKNYMEKMAEMGLIPVVGSQRSKKEDDRKILKNPEDKIMYYQQDSTNLFFIEKDKKSRDLNVYQVTFSSEKENPEYVLVDKFF